MQGDNDTNDAEYDLHIWSAAYVFTFLPANTSQDEDSDNGVDESANGNINDRPDLVDEAAQPNVQPSPGKKPRTDITAILNGRTCRIERVLCRPHFFWQECEHEHDSQCELGHLTPPRTTLFAALETSPTRSYLLTKCERAVDTEYMPPGGMHMLGYVRIKLPRKRGGAKYSE
jgi:hypothetical protein